MSCALNRIKSGNPCFATGKGFAYENLKDKYSNILEEIADVRLRSIATKIRDYLYKKQTSYSKCMYEERNTKCPSTSGKVNIDFKKIGLTVGDEDYFFANKQIIDNLLYPRNRTRATRRASPSPINSISSRTRSKSRSSLQSRSKSRSSLQSRRKSRYGGKKSKLKHKNKRKSQKQM
jgi:hypothetical protein